MVGRRPGSHARAAGNGRRSTAARITAVAVPGIAVIAAVIWLLFSLGVRASAPAQTAAPDSPPGSRSTATSSRSAASPTPAPQSPTRPRNLLLKPRTRRSCPPTASACADLSQHLTWLQSRGRITYGPVRMEPGAPADPDAARDIPRRLEGRGALHQHQLRRADTVRRILCRRRNRIPRRQPCIVISRLYPPHPA